MRTAAATGALLILAALVSGCAGAPEHGRAPTGDRQVVDPGDSNDAIPWGRDVAGPVVPDVFKRAPGADRLAAEEVARQDAYRQLLIQVYGLVIDAKTAVHDVAAASPAVGASLRGRLRGMKETATRYFMDGRVEVTIKVAVRDVARSFQSVCKEVEQVDQVVTDKVIIAMTRANPEKYLTAVGRGALKGSAGAAKLRAMRKAEADCHAQIVDKIGRLPLAGGTTVQEGVLTSSAARSSVSVGLLGKVRFDRHVFGGDGACSVTGRIAVRDVADLLARIHRRYGRGSRLRAAQIEELGRESRGAAITVIGRSLPASAESSNAPTEEKKVIIKRVIRKGIVLE